jgi:hypothetical protein
MYYLVKINGIYDILCGFTILGYMNIPYLGTIHLNMIKKNETNIILRRYYAYWILTYGSMRITTTDTFFIKMSYFIEAFCILNELCNTPDIYEGKAIFVIVTSLLLGYLY